MIQDSCSHRRRLLALVGAGATTHPMPCGVPGGVVSVKELSGTIADAMQYGYERSGRVIDDKRRGLYEQLGLSRDQAPLPSNNANDEKGK